MKKKIVAIILSTALVVTASVLGTLAFLTDRESVVNTFTVGNVAIELDEEKVNENGQKVNPEERTEEGNSYHLIPGQTYIKDPTLTVLSGSEEAYIRLLVEVNCMKELDEIFESDGGAQLLSIFNGYNEEKWIYKNVVRNEEKNTLVYEFRYFESVNGKQGDVVLEPLFESFTIPGEITGQELPTHRACKQTRHHGIRSHP